MACGIPLRKFPDGTSQDGLIAVESSPLGQLILDRSQGDPCHRIFQDIVVANGFERGYPAFGFIPILHREVIQIDSLRPIGKEVGKIKVLCQQSVLEWFKYTGKVR